MSSTASQKRSVLSVRIAKYGVLAMSPCKHCLADGLECRVLSSNRKCANCVRRGIKCDAKEMPLGDFEKIDKERARIRAERAAAEESASAALAKLDRLRKLESHLQQKEDEMIRRGLDSLEELEKVEEEEARARSMPEQPTAGLSASASDLADVTWSQLDLSSWSGLVSGETVAQAPGNA